MKKYLFLLVATAFCTPLIAADTEKPAKLSRAEQMKEDLEKYDANKDGKLDLTEKNKMKEEKKKAKEDAKKAARDARKNEAAENKE